MIAFRVDLVVAFVVVFGLFGVVVNSCCFYLLFGYFVVYCVLCLVLVAVLGCLCSVGDGVCLFD